MACSTQQVRTRRSVDDQSSGASAPAPLLVASSGRSVLAACRVRREWKSALTSASRASRRSGLSSAAVGRQTAKASSDPDHRSVRTCRGSYRRVGVMSGGPAEPAAGMVNSWRCISDARLTIWSNDGVISPERSMRSAPISRAVCRGSSRRHHHAEVDHLTSVVALEHTPTRLLPMSWDVTSPRAITLRPPVSLAVASRLLSSRLNEGDRLGQ